MKVWWGGKWFEVLARKFCAGLHGIYSFHGFNLSSFVICFNVAGLILFWQNIKIRNLC